MGSMAISKLTRFHSIPAAVGSITKLVCARLHQAGIELGPLLVQVGLTPEQVGDPGSRIRVQSQIEFLELAADALRDDYLGFHLARDFELREIGLLYYVLASAERLSDALHQAERYGRIVNEGISIQVRGGQQTAIGLNYINVERRSDRHQMEFWMVSLVRLCRQLTSARLAPSRLRVIHTREKTPSEVRSFLGCEIEFGSDVDEIVFPAAVKLLPVVGADTHLNTLMVQYAEEALSRRKMSSTTFRSKVEKLIAPLLPHGKARADEVARRLGMSHRTLCRSLAIEGLTFSMVLDELRAELAREYLKQGEMPVSQVAWLLGYREVSAFTHAHKRWTGMTPRQSRTQERPRNVSAKKDGKPRPETP
jgi:AraC-like DNA-binding protein